MISKSMSQIFKILFQTGYNNIFILCGVFFSRNVQVKISFSDEKDISGEIEGLIERLIERHTLIETLSEISVAKY